MTTFGQPDEHTKAFVTLKEKLKTAPVLAAPDLSKPFQIATDASAAGIDGVLEQNGHPISYASRACTCPKQKYSATDLEALAVIWSVRHFKHYVYGREIEIITDHKPLQALKKNKHPDEPLGRFRT